ncbi:MAG: ABC transporter ATP-binding protein/permease [Erysipelotrichaceae bacterium]|nr:ABC transporter ATP-binding protein/permease [Erysipelotrichaceae bacterium]
MIEVRGITKIYKKGKRQKSVIDNVSFTLDENGFVFIVGKSGSGKSTLLNLIGGLDNFDSGEIISSGHNLSSFTKKDFDDYRNSYIGFVFQEFYLLDQLTVKENVKLALELLQEEDDNLIIETLEKVGIAELADRYGYELSGGQKQRVAIARALVKKPKIILADEPTGNLDSKNAELVLELLKEISKENLVVIVSHNMESAHKYGDRIIELGDGKVVKDEIKEKNYSNELEFKNEILTLPYCKELNEEELKLVNKNLKSGNIKSIKQKSRGYIPAENKISINEEKIKMSSANMKFKKSLLMSRKFFNKRIFAGLFTIFISSLLVFVLGLCQFCIKYDNVKSINEGMINANEDYFTLYKGRYLKVDNGQWISVSPAVRADISDMDKFYDTGYDGNIYPLYNLNLSISGTQLEHEQALNDSSNMSSLYLKETYGTLVVDEDYLIDMYGKDNKLNVLAGSLEDRPYGIIITDYTADSIMNKFPTKYLSYDDLVGEYKPNGTLRNYINAVIETGYKEKYKDFFDKYLQEYKEIAEGTRMWVSNQEEVNSFWKYVKKTIGLSYSVNPDFANYLGSTASRPFGSINYAEIVVGEREIFKNYLETFIDVADNKNLTGNQIYVGLKLYNILFGTSYAKVEDIDFIPTTITINKYFTLDKNNPSQLLKSWELNIIGVTDNAKYTNNFISSEELFLDIKNMQHFAYGFYFDDITQVGKLYDVAVANEYDSGLSLYKSLGNAGDIIDIFREFITLITIFLCLICILIFINFGLGNIKKHQYEIGVLLALGTDNKTINRIFLTHILIIGLATGILSGTCLFMLVKPVDSMIVEALGFVVKHKAIFEMSVISFDYKIMLVDVGLILGVTLLSSIIPTIYLRRMKPINIIKTKD